MLGDMSGQPGVFVGPNKFTTGITIDFGGHIYEVTKPGAGSAGTETQAFHLENGNVITLKNGTIQCPAEMKTYYWKADAAAADKGISCMIMNYADLTIESVVIDGSNLAPWYKNTADQNDRKKNFLTAYTMSGKNTGTVTLTGTTTINARTPADFAFDTDTGTDYIVDGAGVVIGANVQLAAGNLELKKGAFDDGCGIIPTPGIIKIGTVTKDDGFTINTPVGYVWEENTLVFKPAFEGEGTEDNPWQIKAATDLQTLDQLVKAGTYLKGKCFKQMADINTGDLETWGGIGGMTQSNGSPYSFCGKYDGNNKTLTIPNRTAQKHAGGLFNSVDAGFEIKDITININYVVESGEYGIGAIAGYAGGSNTFTNCKLTGTIKCPYTAGGFVAFQRWQSVPNTYFVNCEVSASVEAKKKFGGFVGAAQGGADFTNCEFKGSIKYFNDAVSGSGSAWADGTCAFHDCTVSGTIGTGLYPYCGLYDNGANTGANKAAADHLANGGTVDGLNFGDTATIEDNLITLVSNDQIVIGGTNKVMSKIGTLSVTLNTVGQTIAFDNALNTAFAATIIADGVVVTTNNEGTVTTYTAIEAPAPQKDWPEEWSDIDADDAVKAKFADWAAEKGDGADLTTDAAKAAFLMNTTVEGLPELKITSIIVADDVATIVVDAGDADLAEVNGVLFLDKSNDLKAWTTHQIPLDGEIKDGNWTVEVEGAKFMKAEVGFKAPAAE